MRSFIIDTNDLQMEDQIGGGGFSTVHRGWWLGTPVAVKKWFDIQNDDSQQQYQQETLTLQGLRHPNVIQFLGSCCNEQNMLMVTEYMPYTLENVLHNTPLEISQARMLDMFLDMVRAVVYLHSQSPPIVHRDIKPANFVLDKAWKIKLCDFGLAANSVQQIGAGTISYMAPELLQAGKSFNAKVDIYALGVTLWEMLSRTVPYQFSSSDEIKQAVINGDRPQIPLHCPQPIATFIQDMWQSDASQRPSAKQLLTKIKTLKQQI
eukprot:TRINITY_DN7229_c0_g1_i2.p1 TRINITY_DN7229_c0_g1~~TRINITY_DN7229_c0_g1_i2.p1  ORF type:complete len:264 (+),score=39.09 TRINITY_DN7229_c0_g1_i2:156-947(+)